MKPIAIIYGSSGGNTQAVAGKLAKQLGETQVTLLDVAKIKTIDIEAHSNLILGTSTWGSGDLQDDWDSFLPKLQAQNLKDKTIALFGLGDSSSYSDTFVDGMGIIYEVIKDKGCHIVGAVATDGYDYESSRAEEADKFVGLALDEDNEYGKTDARIAAWVEAILPEFQ